MRTLSDVLAQHYPAIVFAPPGGDGTARLYDDGSGARIVFWNHDELGIQPTAEQLTAWMSEAPVATLAQIAEHRWKVENGGVTVVIEGTPHRFDTTRENRATWLAVQMQAMANPSFTQLWKTLDGEWLTLTAAQVLAVCAAISAHVATCFAAEALLAANPPPLADLPGAGWPSSAF